MRLQTYNKLVGKVVDISNANNKIPRNKSDERDERPRLQ